MQVIIPYPEDLVKSSQYFNKKQIGKQVDDICKIMMTYINSKLKENNKEFADGNKNVLNHYFSKDGISYLLYYGALLCQEYHKITKSENQGIFTIYGFFEFFDEVYDGDFPTPLKTIKDFKPIYVNTHGREATTENVGELYRKFLGVEE